MRFQWTAGVAVDDYSTDPQTNARRYEPPICVTTTDDEFVDLLREFARVERDPCDKAGDEDLGVYGTTPWHAPFLLKPGATRRREGDLASTMSCYIAVDIDLGNWQLPRLRDTLGGYHCVAHTTTQSYPTDMRWRVILFLSRAITISQYPRIWSYVNGLLHDTLDYPTRNHSRISFMPATWTGGAANVFAVLDGDPLDVDHALAVTPEPQPREKIDFGNVVLSAAPDGTTIILPRMIAEVAKLPVGRRFYRLMCIAARRFRLNGWDLTAMELGAAALLAAEQFSPGKHREKVKHEAENALRWAAENFTPLTPLEKIRRKILWEQQRKLARGW